MFKTTCTLVLWKSQYLDSLSEDLHNQIRSAPPGAILSHALTTNLNQLDKGERKEVVSVVGKQDGRAPLFIACKKGNLDIAEYLLQTCGAEVEQKGLDDNTSHCVSPLWCAAVCGALPIVKCLVKHGANVNSISDTGSTPVQSACSMTHFDIVQYLVEVAQADINIPNFDGGTALMSSVTSAPLCEYLVAHGPDVNAQDIQLNTALHYAIQENRLDTTKLLLANGACPFLKNIHGDDALQTACLEGDTSIFNFLLDCIPQYTRERRAEVHELMGSTFLDVHEDFQMALYFWRKALSIRYDCEPQLPKPPLDYSPMYANILDNEGNDIQIVEFQTRGELEIIATDEDQMRVNSLLIAERILGAAHNDVILRISHRGGVEDEDGNHLYCFRLWRYELQLRIMNDSILDGVTSITTIWLTHLCFRFNGFNQDDSPRTQDTLRVSDLLGTFELLTQQLLICSEIVRIRPVHEGQQENYDKCLRCCTHLLYLLLLRAPNKTVEQTRNLRKATNMLLRHNVRMCSTGDTLLHMVVGRSNTIYDYFWDDDEFHVFPSTEVAALLIDCGADVNAVNGHRSLPLHVVVSSDDFDRKMVELLLHHGSHVDQLDNDNTNPLVRLQSRPGIDFSALNHISLKCTSARVVCKFNIPFKGDDLPRELIRFVELHRPTLPMMMNGIINDDDE